MKRPYCINLETSAYCNRTCSACIRNSNPNKEETDPWFKQNYMSDIMISEVFKQAKEYGILSSLCLCHYNEPLLDPRIIDIAKIAKEYGFKYVYFCTNGDYLTSKIAMQLDGVLDRITVSLYDVNSRAERARFVSMFQKTRVWCKGQMVANHFGAYPPLNDICSRMPTRLIINWRGDYLLCCDDMVGSFNLGNFKDITLVDYWFGEKHLHLFNTLLQPGGRSVHPYCSSCPRVQK